MQNNSRKERIERILKNNLAPKSILVRDDSKLHEGHAQVNKTAKETHFYVKMVLDFPENTSRVTLHRKVYKLLDTEFSKGLHALELELIRN